MGGARVAPTKMKKKNNLYTLCHPHIQFTSTLYTMHLFALECKPMREKDEKSQLVRISFLWNKVVGFFKMMIDIEERGQVKYSKSKKKLLLLPLDL